MQSTTLSFANMHNHGELFANILRARRESFIVKNNWDLPETMGMEYDQYDTPVSRWFGRSRRHRSCTGWRQIDTYNSPLWHL